MLVQVVFFSLSKHEHITLMPAISFMILFEMSTIDDIDQKKHKMFSNPLHHYVRGLRLLKTFGLPLKFEEDENGCIIVKENRFIKCMLFTGGKYNNSRIIKISQMNEAHTF